MDGNQFDRQKEANNFGKQQMSGMSKRWQFYSKQPSDFVVRVSYPNTFSNLIRIEIEFNRIEISVNHFNGFYIGRCSQNDSILAQIS